MLYRVTITGSLIHIDFGYMFQSAPGGGSAFGGWEASSFKLTDDFVFIAAGPPGTRPVS